MRQCAAAPPARLEPKPSLSRYLGDSETETAMGRFVLLWLLDVPIPIFVLIWAFGWLH
jgi:hypothetical protein